MSDWAREYFECGYAQRWRLAPPSEEDRAVAASLWNSLQLSTGARVVDIGCGHGKYTIAFAQRGAEAIGVDFADTLLLRARRLADELDIHARWLRGDMRRLPLRDSCATAAISTDAFGFFETDDENELVLREAARVLEPGGRLAMKVVNGRPILDDFCDSSRDERDGSVITIVRTLTLGPPRMTERVSISGRRGAGEYERRQRLYGADELTAAFERIGLSVIGVHADPHGSAFDAASSRAMWIVAART